MAYEAIFSFEYLATSIRSKGKVGKEKREEEENREMKGGEEEGRRHQPPTYFGQICHCLHLQHEHHGAVHHPVINILRLLLLLLSCTPSGSSTRTWS